MNVKKTNYLYLGTILFEAFVVGLILVLVKVVNLKLGLLTELVLNQLMILLPSVLFLVFTKENPLRFIPFGKLKLSVVFLTILFTFLCMPLIVLANAISMLFVENAVNDMAALMTSLPAFAVVAVVGLMGPACEEFVFRGVIYHGYRRSGRVIAAMLLSAFLFGLTHLNFNQMSYAILVGVLGVLLIECTGSIFASMIFHMVINTSNVIPVVLNPQMYENGNEGAMAQLETLGMGYKDALYMAIGVYAVIAVVTTSLAILVLSAIADISGKKEHVRAIFTTKPEQRSRMITWPLVVSVVLCFAYMIVTL